MAQIFVSYKRIDKDKVFPIVEKIKHELGCDCWVDLDGIESSVQFASVICSAIDKSDVVLFMHSSAHLTIDFETDWTVKELTYAQIKKKRVVLVKLDNTPLDNIFLMEYGSKNNIDSQDPTQFNKLLNDLRSWLHLPHPKSTSQFEAMCPCGSGKLFKDCHGKTVAPTPASAPVAKSVSASTPSPKPVEKIWKVGDYYNVDGKEGVVFWVDKTGKHGKIVSLDEAQLQWCVTSLYHENCVTNRLVRLGYDHADGYENSDVLKENYNWYSYFPALAWCAQHGTEWYIPSINELITLLQDDVYQSVNRTLFTCGKVLQRKNSESRYWSSTSSSDSAIRPWIYHMLDKKKYMKSGFEKHYVRAICAF